MMKRLVDAFTFQDRLTRKQFLMRCVMYLIFILTLVLIASIVGVLFFTWIIPETSQSVSFLILLISALSFLISFILFTILMIPLLMMMLSLIIRRTRDTRFHWGISLTLYIIVVVNMYMYLYGGYQSFVSNEMVDNIFYGVNIVSVAGLLFILLQPTRES